ncbi:hypothetical protein TTHERM_00220600 (macronuclear) [Tetrahymena thermophila SB210]|uniref:Uncharacterized protein n=1 Tax=Tetrahymena thermophila (strain SB210) TaxID=312017 RepID=I7MKV5_TETTS|nr:hypothetical protein TTHERM_00220600 [Tetrahymena thermophila SB210]EAS00387.1 hypothetical protein TTHERM_00220600 [Tetrahymena thermophila SB210]6Z1P_AR Chain AR, mL103 [Tetrahymena thermophila SB210]|eukprot:XP_001020632.1 hypothetical protein TTHERM_00220600 [Tetrahymena thermophila SB210]
MLLSQSIQKAVANAFKQISRSQYKAISCFSSSDKNDNGSNNQEGDSSKNNEKKQATTNDDIYIHKTSYNLEQFKSYTQNVEKALKDLNQEKEKLENSSPFDLLPRRKRRVYDRPLHDLDISNYECWRSYDKMIFKTHKHAARVVCKINLSPRALKHAFGIGSDVSRNSDVSTREYDFEDSNLDSFLLYDYKATTEYHGNNDPNYDYQNQDQVPPKKRKQQHPTPQEFWESDEPHAFRVNCSNYADYHKFKKWIQTEIEKRASEKSYEEKIIERFGPYKIYDQYDQKYDLVKEPSVFKYGREYYLEKGKKFSEKEMEENPYLKPIKPAKQMEDKYRVAWPYQWNPKPTQ